MDTTTQIVLVLMIIVLGSTLTAVGVMLVFVLKDLRASIGKLNQILDNFREVSLRAAAGSLKFEEALASMKNTIDVFKEQAASPVGSLMGLIRLIGSIRGSKHRAEEVEQDE